MAIWGIAISLTGGRSIGAGAVASSTGRQVDRAVARAGDQAAQRARLGRVEQDFGFACGARLQRGEQA